MTLAAAASRVIEEASTTTVNASTVHATDANATETDARSAPEPSPDTGCSGNQKPSHHSETGAHPPPPPMKNIILPPSLLRHRLDATLAALPPLPGDVPLPAHVADFVWASLVARGGAKSLAISDGAALVVEANPLICVSIVSIAASPASPDKSTSKDTSTMDAAVVLSRRR